ncbi:VWA domain-containing protein [Streptomyces kaempferi]|uniref:VWA domain-containing protein n=1 Tax=Streptomyces kaempferi TaxID=333725 RepID=A0ABW3X6G4_9ACTN
MGILTLLRNAFGRSRQGRDADAETSREASAPSVSAPEAEHVPSQEAEPVSAPIPSQAAERAPAETEPKIPAPSSEPKPGPTSSVVDELVSAAFDNVTVPKPAESTESTKATEPTEATKSSEPKTGTTSSPETVTEAAPADEVEAEAEAEAQVEAEAKPEGAAEPVAAPTSEVEPEAEVVAEPEVVTEADAGVDAAVVAEAEPEAEVAPKAEVEPEAEAEVTPEPEAETEAAPEAEAAVVAEAEAVVEAVAPEAEPIAEAPEVSEPEAEEPAAANAPAAEPVAQTESEPEPAEAVAARAAEPTADDESVTGGAGTKTDTAEGAAEAGTDATAPAVPLAHVQSTAATLTTAYREAAATLEKQNLTGARAKVYLVLDRSASMRAYYKDGSAQALGEQALALAAHLDPEATVPVVFFSTELDGTGELTLADHENKVDELHGTLGRMGRTSYHVAVQEVLARHEKSQNPAAPALVIFQTDGAPDAKTPATQALTEAAATHPAVFFSFVAFGEHENKAFDYLRKLKTANASFFHAGPTPRELTDAEVYEGVLANWRP